MLDSFPLPRDCFRYSQQQHRHPTQHTADQEMVPTQICWYQQWMLADHLRKPFRKQEVSREAKRPPWTASARSMT